MQAPRLSMYPPESLLNQHSQGILESALQFGQFALLLPLLALSLLLLLGDILRNAAD